MTSGPHPEVTVGPGRTAAWSSRPGRPSIRVRDLGIGEATNGALGAVIVKAVSACTEPQDLHRHEVTTQFFLLLSGRLVIEYEGERLEVLAGDVVTQPGGVAHRILEHSRDLELVEVTSPATFTSEAVT